MKKYQAAYKDWEQKPQKSARSWWLACLGTERHDARRIDNQLRGRSGRQGDPGSSRFYVSLEDDLMRIFGGEQVSKLMDFLKIPEDQPIESGMVSKSLEQAQTKVEGFHFDMRKRVVEYDDVMNKQREIIYKRRYAILEEADDKDESHQLKDRILELLDTEIDNIVNARAAQGLSDEEYDAIIKEFLSYYSV
jgi:preprotein translocase subunit SecA